MARLDSRNLKGLIVAVLAAWFLWETPLVYPVRLFSTMCHESGHALAALATGGRVGSIQVAPNTAGLTTTAGGFPLAVVSGGYLGSVFFGCGIIMLASDRRFSRYVLESLGALFLVLTVCYARDSFTALYGLATGIALWKIGRTASAETEFYIAQTLGVLTASMALMDIRTLLPGAGILVGVGGAPGVTDAQQLARMTHIPATFWALLWAAISLGAVFWVLRRSLDRRAGSMEI
ncbi:MAG: M50 family metallopeptidase [Candidatus Wallbacteria bacterium]|nr:M50 family metallopeptidase [Candidatus Wallbacteria bacterium]MBI4868100.1 M50 family metallopeptidase [Candidatus Wallbacteria bacterium]